MALIDFIKENKIASFYLSILFLLIIYITKSNIIFCIFSLLILQTWSYFSHRWTHEGLMDPLSNLHLLHHKNQSSLLLEFIVNFIVYGGFIFLPINILLSYLGKIELFNNYIIIFWSILYSTYHVINYHYKDFESHKMHHVDTTTEFGPPWMDILFETHNEKINQEKMDSSVINMSIAFIVTISSYYYFSDYLTKK